MAKGLRTRLLLFLMMGQLAASCQGTETGNPGNEMEEVPEEAPAGIATNPIDDFLDTICVKINECKPSISLESCEEALGGADGANLSDDLGLSETPLTIGEIRTGLNEGTLQADSEVLTLCLAQVSSLSCSVVRPEVSPGDLSGAENLIPDLCADLLHSVP